MLGEIAVLGFRFKNETLFYTPPKVLDYSVVSEPDLIIDSFSYLSYQIPIVADKPDSSISKDGGLTIWVNNIRYEISSAPIQSDYQDHINSMYGLPPKDINSFIEKTITIRDYPSNFFDSKFDKLDREQYLRNNYLMVMDNKNPVLKSMQNEFVSYQLGHPPQCNFCQIYIISEKESPINISLISPNIDHPNWNQKTIDAIIGSIRLQ